MQIYVLFAINYLCTKSGIMAEQLPQDEGQFLEAAESSDELYERFSFRTDKGQEPLRIDKYLMNRIEGATRNKLQRAINAGMVMVNLPTAGVDYHVPFGGRKGSSYGPREQGRYAQEFYTTVKTAYTLA